MEGNTILHIHLVESLKWQRSLPCSQCTSAPSPGKTKELLPLQALALQFRASHFIRRWQLKDTSCLWWWAGLWTYFPYKLLSSPSSSATPLRGCLHFWNILSSPLIISPLTPLILSSADSLRIFLCRFFLKHVRVFFHRPNIANLGALGELMPVFSMKIVRFSPPCFLRAAWSE